MYLNTTAFPEFELEQNKLRGANTASQLEPQNSMIKEKNKSKCGSGASMPHPETKINIYTHKKAEDRMRESRTCKALTKLLLRSMEISSKVMAGLSGLG